MLGLYYYHPFEAGTDEAGRGCLAGPVTAAAVILPENFEIGLLDDSKKLTASTRHDLKSRIEEQAVCFGICHIPPEQIDRLNILNASFAAMHGALIKLTQKPPFIIVDGNRFKPYANIDHACIIQGDGKYSSIAAASVLAKTHRDLYMEKIHREFPMYNWKQNKGYPTPEHREAIRLHGSCHYHRKSFRLLPGQLKLDI